MARALLLFAGVALVAVLFARLGPGAVAEVLDGLGWGVVVCPVIYGLHHAVRTVALAVALPPGRRVPYWRLLLVRLSGEALQYLTFTGPLAAEPAKAWLLRREGLQSADAVASTLTEYVTYMGTASLVSAVGLLALRLAVPMPRLLRVAVSSAAVGALAVLVVIVMALGGRRSLAGGLVRRAASQAGLARGVTVSEDWVRTVERGLRRNLRDDPYRRRVIVGCEALAHALLLGELWWLLRLFGVAPTWLVVLVVEGATKISNSLFFFVPARAGVDEATLTTVVASLGVPAVVGLGISLVRRARALLVGTAGLGAAWLLTRSLATPPPDGAGVSDP